jgi:hypothetical protein
MGLGPLLEEVELALAPARPPAVQVVAARLQQQLAVAGKAQRGVGTVELFLDDDVPAGQPFPGHGVVLVAGLQARAAQVRRAGVFEDLGARKRVRGRRNGACHVVLSGKRCNTPRQHAMEREKPTTTPGAAMQGIQRRRGLARDGRAGRLSKGKMAGLPAPSRNGRVSRKPSKGHAPQRTRQRHPWQGQDQRVTKSFSRKLCGGAWCTSKV